MNPEARARLNIDAQLSACGWTAQDRGQMDLSARRGVAVREFPTTTGPADYILFVDRRAVGVIEAKAEGDTLSGVAEQAAQYATSLPPNIPHIGLPLPFLYESTGVETFFRDGRDPSPRSRRVFTFHRPETLAECVTEGDPGSGETARDLVYRLYIVCERKGGAQNGLAYNMLVVAWPRLKDLAWGKPQDRQTQLL